MGDGVGQGLSCHLPLEGCLFQQSACSSSLQGGCPFVISASFISIGIFSLSGAFISTWISLNKCLPAWILARPAVRPATGPAAWSLGQTEAVPKQVWVSASHARAVWGQERGLGQQNVPSVRFQHVAKTPVEG